MNKKSKILAAALLLSVTTSYSYDFVFCNLSDMDAQVTPAYTGIMTQGCDTNSIDIPGHQCTTLSVSYNCALDPEAMRVNGTVVVAPKARDVKKMLLESDIAQSIRGHWNKAREMTPADIEKKIAQTYEDAKLIIQQANEKIQKKLDSGRKVSQELLDAIADTSARDVREIVDSYAAKAQSMTKEQWDKAQRAMDEAVDRILQTELANSLIQVFDDAYELTPRRVYNAAKAHAAITKIVTDAEKSLHNRIDPVLKKVRAGWSQLRQTSLQDVYTRLHKGFEAAAHSEQAQDLKKAWKKLAYAETLYLAYDAQDNVWSLISEKQK